MNFVSLAVARGEQHRRCGSFPKCGCFYRTAPKNSLARLIE